MNKIIVQQIVKKYDTPLYVFEKKEFINNYRELENSYKSIYPNFRIAYSFKTNYTPAICNIVKELNGYAEVVSEMEYSMAKLIGFNPRDIIVNGPGKWNGMDEMLFEGAIVMLDNPFEFERALHFANSSDRTIRLGFRINFELKKDRISRFGFDINDVQLASCIKRARENSHIEIIGLHFHQSGARSLEDWKNRIIKIVEIAKHLLREDETKLLDLGSGMFGHMDPSFAQQFDQSIPSFKQYADEVATIALDSFGGVRQEKMPILVVEPGTTIVANTMTYVTRVLSEKTIRGKNFAIVDGSVHQLGEIGKKKKLPLTIISNNPQFENKKYDITGYTCLEDDVLYSDLEYDLKPGDLLCFGNVGAYTNVLKPPFIQEGCKIVMIDEHDASCLVKREETVADILASYVTRSSK